MPSGKGERIAGIIRRACWIGISAHSAFVPLFAILGFSWLAAFNVLSTSMWVAAALLNRRGRSTLGMWIIMLEVMAHAGITIAFLGWECGFQYYLIPLIPFVMFNDRLATEITVVASGAVIGYFIVLMELAPVVTLDPEILQFMHYVNWVIPMMTMGMVSYYFRRASMDVESQMETAANTDALTGLPNRRRISERLREEELRFTRTQEPFSIALADIDNFKDINDTYGHDVGDRVLADVANVLRAGTRGSDNVGRWGGEEFVLLFPGTNLEAAGGAVERLRSTAVDALRVIPGCDSPVTLTFGVAVFDPSSSLGECLKVADAAMYRGKESGRDQVVLAKRPRASKRLAAASAAGRESRAASAD